ncbi:MAG: ABC transporter permease [Deltaproteobacteria bacterium]|nr:ABC transporter permease [Deltaproteobacteria bacterium]
MFLLFIKKAFQDIFRNRFLNTVSITTIVLSVLIVSTTALFFINANDLMNSWKHGVKIMAYLKPQVPESDLPDIRHTIQKMYGVEAVRFISKKDALDTLKKEMARQSSIFSDLKENPLPDAFEIRMISSSQSWEKVETLSKKIESLPSVEEVEYGKRWLSRFENIFNLFRLAGFSLGAIFVMATILIISNTIRLVLYARREELEIMRLVGASNAFIKIPFYIEGIIIGILGGIVGLTILFAAFSIISSNVNQDFTSGLFRIRFLHSETLFLILFCSMLVGWLGCYFSLKQFLK